MDLKQTLSMDKIKEFFTTKKGKGIAAGLMIIVVLLVVLFIVTFALPRPEESVELIVNRKPIKDASNQQANQQQTTETATSTSTPDGAGNNIDTSTIEYSNDITHFRDPFAPFSETTSTTGSQIVFTSSALGNQTGNSTNETTSTVTSTTQQPNSISLERITIRDGVRYGTFIYNGVQIVAKAGDQIEDSPYQVLDIGDGSATLLYGDDRLTLQLGDEIIK